MERLTTEKPQNNIETMHNLVYIKDKEVYLRGITNTGEDINLYDYIRREVQLYAQDDNETIAELMCDEIDDTLKLAYWLAVGFAEVREQLKRYEDSGITPEEIEGMKDAPKGE